MTTRRMTEKRRSSVALLSPCATCSAAECCLRESQRELRVKHTVLLVGCPQPRLMFKRAPLMFKWEAWRIRVRHARGHVLRRPREAHASCDGPARPGRALGRSVSRCMRLSTCARELTRLRWRRSLRTTSVLRAARSLRDCSRVTRPGPSRGVCARPIRLLHASFSSPLLGP